MASFDKAMWRRCYSQGEFPKFRCPRCERGRMVVDLSTLRVKEPEYSAIQSQHQDHEPDWDVMRFSVQLTCDEKSCGEISFALGDAVAERYYDVAYDIDAWETLLCPQGFYPAPPIIDVPHQVPKEIKDGLNKAFELFWPDLNAAANRLRVCVEHIMDEQGVRAEMLNKKGKLIRLDLDARIAEFRATHPKHAETLTALRMIGNLGSHKGGVQAEAILDAFQVFEDSLAELYGERSVRLTEITQKLIKHKGAY